MLLKKLFEEHQESRDRLGETKTVSVADDKWSADCIDYSVSTKKISLYNKVPLVNYFFGKKLIFQVHSNPVSIHAPLTRLLAGLSLYMEKYGLVWLRLDQIMLTKKLDWSVPLKNLKQEMYKSHELDIVEKPTVMELIEPSLRSAVLIAQVHAGMWRRNGFSVIDQVKHELSTLWNNELE